MQIFMSDIVQQLETGQIVQYRPSSFHHDWTSVFSHDLQNSSLFLKFNWKVWNNWNQPTDYKCNRNQTAFQKWNKENNLQAVLE